MNEEYTHTHQGGLKCSFPDDKCPAFDPSHELNEAIFQTQIVACREQRDHWKGVSDALAIQLRVLQAAYDDAVRALRLVCDSAVSYERLSATDYEHVPHSVLSKARALLSPVPFVRGSGHE
jgi:hypothetical protein